MHVAIHAFYFCQSICNNSLQSRLIKACLKEFYICNPYHQLRYTGFFYVVICRYTAFSYIVVDCRYATVTLYIYARSNPYLQSTIYLALFVLKYASIPSPINLELKCSFGARRGPAESWIAAAAVLWAFLRVWGANHSSELKRERARIVGGIASLDAQADARPFLEGE